MNECDKRRPKKSKIVNELADYMLGYDKYISRTQIFNICTEISINNEDFFEDVDYNIKQVAKIIKTFFNKTVPKNDILLANNKKSINRTELFEILTKLSEAEEMLFNQIKYNKNQTANILKTFFDKEELCMELDNQQLQDIDSENDYIEEVD